MGPPLIILLLFGAVIDVAISVPAGKPLTAGPPDSIYNTKSCLVMTPEREGEINAIVEKISSFIYNLTLDYDYLDITLVKLAVEGHYDDEAEEKETDLEIIINDCVSAEKARQNKSGYYTNKPDNAQIKTGEPKTEGDTTPQTAKVYPSDTAVDTASVLVVENPDDTEVSTDIKISPQLIRLNLDETGEKLVKLYQEKHGNLPFLVYIRKVLDNLEYMFLN